MFMTDIEDEMLWEWLQPWWWLMLERECVGVKFKMLTILAVLATNVDYALTLANQHSKDVAAIKILSRTLSSTFTIAPISR